MGEINGGNNMKTETQTVKQDNCSGCSISTLIPPANCKRYNRWTNYETWVAHLSFRDSAGTQARISEAAKDLLRRARSSAEKGHKQEERATHDLCKYLEELVRAGYPANLGAGMYADLLNASISQINFHEIAEYIIQQVKGPSSREMA